MSEKPSVLEIVAYSVFAGLSVVASLVIAAMGWLLGNFSAREPVKESGLIWYLASGCCALLAVGFTAAAISQSLRRID
jgi:hypothetical protein